MFQIEACNDFFCDAFTPKDKGSPKIWAENWTGWSVIFIFIILLEKLVIFIKFSNEYFRFRRWGSSDPHRTVEDIAFGVARFFQRGGSLMNYYMVSVF